MRRKITGISFHNSSNVAFTGKPNGAFLTGSFSCRSNKNGVNDHVCHMRRAKQ